MSDNALHPKIKQLIEEWNRREDEITQKAKADGTWLPGLDSNKELFETLNEEMYGRIETIKRQLK